MLPAPGSTLGFTGGGRSSASHSQGLTASSGMSSSSSMTDPLGWLGPSEARNTGAHAGLARPLGGLMSRGSLGTGRYRPGQLRGCARSVGRATDGQGIYHSCCRHWPCQICKLWCAGVPAAPTQEDDLFKDPGWQDPVLGAFGAGAGLTGASQAAQQSLSGPHGHGMGANMGGRRPAARPLGGPPGAGLDGILGVPASKPASVSSEGSLPPRLAPPPPGSTPVHFSPVKLGQGPAQHSRKASLSLQQDSLI